MVKKSAKPEEKGAGEEKTADVEVSRARALSPFEEMERMFDAFGPRGWMHRFGWDRPPWRDLMEPFESRMPRIDVVERDDQILVRAEVPGVAKENLDVSLTENAVTIKGSTHREQEEKHENFFRREISRGSFTRTVPLPDEVDAGSAKAKFKNGVLELTIDKLQKAKRRKIKVE